MFKHLLLPTDGTVLSERAVHVGIELAHCLGARVSARHVNGGRDDIYQSMTHSHTPVPLSR